MLSALTIATVLDLGLGVLLSSVSGFVLQGVNNNGPVMPDAILFLLMIALCFVAPIAAWSLRGRIGSASVLAIAFSPPIIFGTALLAEPAIRSLYKPASTHTYCWFS